MPVFMSDWPPHAIVLLLVSAAVGYFCGCFNGAVIVSKFILRDDVRTHGSGNAGLTNFYRTFGGPLTAAVILTDVLKAIIAILIGVALMGDLFGSPLLAKYWAGTFCMLGHMFPCMFKFKGGKGILSGGAMVLTLNWQVILVVWGGFLVLFLLTRYVSLGSIWAGASFPFATWFMYQDVRVLLLSIVVGGLIVWKHRGNAKRLLKGEESKFSFHRQKS